MTFTTDIILAFIIILLFLRGWTRGFMRSILGPIAIFGAGWISMIYYAQTQNILISALIGILGPLVIGIAVSLLLNALKLTKPKEERTCSPLSRFLGGCFTLSWTGTLLFLFLFLITIIPLKINWLTSTQSHIENSMIYQKVVNSVKHVLPLSVQETNNTLHQLQDPEYANEIGNSKEYQSLENNKTYQEIMADEEIVTAIKEKNFVKLVSNEKFLKAIQDKEFLSQMVELNKLLFKQNSK